MIIQDVIDTAKYSELNNTVVKDNTPAIILFMNAGMLELYKRFPIQVSEHIFTLTEGATTYALPADFLYPLEVYGQVPEDDPKAGPPRLSINEEEDPEGVFFPSFKEIQIPLNTDGAKISMLYVSKPPRYTEDDVAEELDLPDTLIEPLLQYMAYKAHAGITSGIQEEHNVHYQRFDRSCNKARELGVAYPLDSWSMPHRIINRGFV